MLFKKQTFWCELIIFELGTAFFLFYAKPKLIVAFPAKN